MSMYVTIGIVLRKTHVENVFCLQNIAENYFDMVNNLSHICYDKLLIHDVYYIWYDKLLMHEVYYIWYDKL